MIGYRTNANKSKENPIINITIVSCVSVIVVIVSVNGSVNDGGDDSDCDCVSAGV